MLPSFLLIGIGSIAQLNPTFKKGKVNEQPSPWITRRFFQAPMLL